MRATIEAIQHDWQRYTTVGDWRLCPGDEIQVSVSQLGDWRMELLVGVHELIEAALCKHRGISEEAVTEFDTTFKGEGEPGDDPDAPYRVEHAFASTIECLLAAELDVDWPTYEAVIEAL